MSAILDREVFTRSRDNEYLHRRELEMMTGQASGVSSRGIGGFINSAATSCGCANARRGSGHRRHHPRRLGLNRLATTGRGLPDMKGRQKIPASQFNPDQLALLINALDQHNPDAWMLTDEPDSDNCWSDEYRYILRDDIENVLAQTALPFALRQLEWLNRAGRRLH